ncbi:MAG: hypothetical protein ACXWCN_11835, partial [Caldimonas sp.]
MTTSPASSMLGLGLAGALFLAGPAIAQQAAPAAVEYGVLSLSPGPSPGGTVAVPSPPEPPPPQAASSAA